MEIISVGRAGGKTYHYLNSLARNGNAILITIHEPEAARCRDLLIDLYCAAYGVDEEDLSSETISRLKKQVVSLSGLDSRKLRGRFSPSTIFVDNADLIFYELFGQRVTSMSMSEPVGLKTSLP